MKILCATNFEPGADAAVRAALALAERTGGSLELMHVLGPPSLSPVTGCNEVLVAEAVALSHAMAQKQLEAEAQTLRQASRVPVTTRLDAGPVDTCLTLRADETAADLIVLGTSSRPRLQRWLMGSVAERVMRLGDRAVLLVPPGEPGTASLQQGTESKILIALDERQDCGAALNLARRLRARRRCDIVFLRLYWPVEEYRRLGLTGPRDLFQSDVEVVKDLESSVRQRVGELPGAGRVEIEVEACWGPREEAILTAARARGCDLIVMGAESRHGLARLTHPPVSDRMARSASPVPILFLPPQPAPAPAATRGPAPISTILAATDFSEGGDLAARAAYGLLAGRGGVVELCHVHERPLGNPAYAYDEPAGRLADGERAALEKRLRDLIPADAHAHRIITHVSVVDGGQASTALVQAAERLRVDALVLGAGSHGATHRALLGSVAQTVVRASRRPVMLIPAPSPDA